MTGEDDMLVDVDIPVDIEGEYDLATGMFKTVPAKKKSSGGPAVNPEIDALRRERDAERTARAEAEERAKVATQDVRKLAGVHAETRVQAYGAHYRVNEGRLEQLTNAIASTEAITENAKRELVDVEVALSDPNLDPTERVALVKRKVEAQGHLARGESELVVLHGHKNQQEGAVAQARKDWETEAARAEAIAREPEPKTPEPKQDQFDPEKWLESCPAATKPWLREHPEWRTSPSLFRRINNFAQDYSEDHGVANLDSKDFVAALNDKFFPTGGGDGYADVDEDPAPRQRNAPAAPVSRSSASNGTPTVSSGKRGQVSLSKAEQDIAIGLWPDMDPKAAREKYARNKLRAIADGQYSR